MATHTSTMQLDVLRSELFSSINAVEAFRASDTEEYPSTLKASIIKCNELVDTIDGLERSLLPPHPIVFVPDEVLLSIFRWVVTVEPDMILQLALVCTNWEAFIVAQPKLWSYISIGGRDSNPSPTASLSLLLSRSCPLDMHLSIPHASIRPFRHHEALSNRVFCTMTIWLPAREFTVKFDAATPKLCLYLDEPIEFGFPSTSLSIGGLASFSPIHQVPLPGSTVPLPRFRSAAPSQPLSHSLRCLSVDVSEQTFHWIDVLDFHELRELCLINHLSPYPKDVTRVLSIANKHHQLRTLELKTNMEADSDSPPHFTDDTFPDRPYLRSMLLEIRVETPQASSAMSKFVSKLFVSAPATTYLQFEAWFSDVQVTLPMLRRILSAISAMECLKQLTFYLNVDPALVPLVGISESDFAFAMPNLTTLSVRASWDAILFLFKSLRCSRLLQLQLDTLMWDTMDQKKIGELRRLIAQCLPADTLTRLTLPGVCFPLFLPSLRFLSIPIDAAIQFFHEAVAPNLETIWTTSEEGQSYRLPLNHTCHKLTKLSLSSGDAGEIFDDVPKFEGLVEFILTLPLLRSVALPSRALTECSYIDELVLSIESSQPSSSPCSKLEKIASPDYPTWASFCAFLQRRNIQSILSPNHGARPIRLIKFPVLPHRNYVDALKLSLCGKYLDAIEPVPTSGCSLWPSRPFDYHELGPQPNIRCCYACQSSGLELGCERGVSNGQWIACPRHQYVGLYDKVTAYT